MNNHDIQLEQFKSVVTKESRALLSLFPKGTIVFTKGKGAKTDLADFELSLNPNKVELTVTEGFQKENFSFIFSSKLFSKNRQVMLEKSGFYSFSDHLVAIYNLISAGSCVYRVSR